MKCFDSILDLIGRTPLLKLDRLTEPGMATVLAKMELLNPGGSVKDRMAIHMIRKAEERGQLKPGATLIESTSGNTGVGLAMAAAVLGYRCIFTIPDKMSKEKIDSLKAFGAEVLVTRTDLSHDHPESYVGIARRLASEIPNSLYIDQYHNMDNPETHYLTTGPEIWEDTDGLIDAFVGGIGTGGTISGAGKYLKEQAKKAGRELSIVCPDPVGSIYDDVFHKRPVTPPRIYTVEGIGHDFMVDTLDFSVIDEVMPITDRDSFLTARRLVREEGIFAGGSAGTAVFGALEVARRLGTGKIVVVIIPDVGGRYLSKCFDDDWMRDMGFLGEHERLGTVRELLQSKGRAVEFAQPEESIANVVTRLGELGYSQMPIRTPAGQPRRMIHEIDLLKALAGGKCTHDEPVSRVAAPLQGEVALGDSLAKVHEVFDTDHIAVVVENEEVIGIITKIDVIEFLARRS